MQEHIMRLFRDSLERIKKEFVNDPLLFLKLLKGYNIKL